MLQHNKKITSHQKVIAFASIFLLTLFFQLRHINDKPKYRHSWALADHYAVALNFKTNNFRFFYPETYCLNPQFTASKFSSKKKQKSKNDFFDSKLENPKGITAIDFPIHHYISAFLMKVLNTSQPFVYRLYSFLISLLGLFFLFKLSYSINKSFWLSLAVVFFVLLSPTYNYYSYSFIPTAQSLSLLLIASYFYYKYLQNNHTKYFTISVFLLLIASLARLPFSIYIIALICMSILDFILYRIFDLKKTLILLGSISIVLCYFLYNKLFLAYEYGSVFLNYPLFPRNIEDVYLSIFGTLKHEVWRYATPIHYIIIICAVLHLKKQKSLLKLKKITLLILIIICGVTVYSFLMLKQFIAHDYYILDTFFTPVVFLIIYYSASLTKTKFHKKAITFGAIALLFFVVISEFGYYYSFKETSAKKTTQAFEYSSKILDSLNIKSNDHILLLGAVSPNNAFIEMKRKGFINKYNNTYCIKRALSWDIDYIITQNFNFKNDVLPVYPKFKQENKLIFQNSNFAVYKPNSNHQDYVSPKKNQ